MANGSSVLPAGEMQGTVHRLLLEERSSELKAGAVLLLKQVQSYGGGPMLVLRASAVEISSSKKPVTMAIKVLSGFLFWGVGLTKSLLLPRLEVRGMCKFSHLLLPWYPERKDRRGQGVLVLLFPQ